jgi:2-polyprenyl-6-methoxyphenol hydroxylase-like FAD-dependent oxidoreductase
MTTTAAPTVLIVGAGPAGSTLAYWLAKRGYDVTVIDRTKRIISTINRIDIRGAALEVIRKMDLFDAVMQRSLHIARTEYVDANGFAIVTLNESAFGNEEGSDAELKRSDLVELLIERSNDAAQYIWDDTVTHLEQTNDSVHVTFAHRESRAFDIVIGADGIHSATRAMAFATSETDISRFLGCYVALYTVPNYLKLHNTQHMYNEPGATIGITATEKEEPALAMFAFASPRLEYDYHDQQAQKVLLRQRFTASRAWETQRLLELAEASDFFYFDGMTQITQPSLHNKRVALVGDAAYCPAPVSGQGTSMAIVGAYILADELSGANGNCEQAFTGYERRMERYIQKNHAIGVLSASSLVEKSKMSIRIRNVFIRRPLLVKSMYRKIQKQIKDASNSIDI